VVSPATIGRRRYGREKVMPTGLSGGFIAPGVLLPPPEMSHRAFSAKGGRARTAAKLAASMRNPQKANAAREARRGMK
jgi:hypothetical protein